MCWRCSWFCIKYEDQIRRFAREGNQIIRYLCIGFESWELNKDIAKRLATFGRKVLRRIFGGIKVNENWRKRRKEELM